MLGVGMGVGILEDLALAEDLLLLVEEGIQEGLQGLMGLHELAQKLLSNFAQFFPEFGSML